MSIVTTPGSATANSYGTLNEAEAYFTSRLYADIWNAASDDNKEAALIWSTHLLDAAFKWTGTAVDAVQVLAWPRNGMFSLTGFAIPNTTIPLQLKYAEFEFAGALLASDRASDDASLKVMGTETTLTSVKAGPVALTWSGGNFTTLEAFDAYVRSLGSDFNYLSKIVPDVVRFLIPPSWYIQAQLKRKILFGAF